MGRPEPSRGQSGGVHVLQRRKGYVYGLITTLVIIGVWNFIGLIDEEHGPRDHMAMHNLGLAIAIILTVLYCGDREADIAKMLKNGIELGKKMGAERERQRHPKPGNTFEVVIVPLQKHHS